MENAIHFIWRYQFIPSMSESHHRNNYLFIYKENTHTHSEVKIKQRKRQKIEFFLRFETESFDVSINSKLFVVTRNVRMKQ